jgi:hypothetical protein
MPQGGHNRINGGTVEAVRTLKVIALARAGVVGGGRLGSWQWTYASGDRASIRISGGTESITLNYRCRDWKSQGWQDVEQRVSIVRTPCRFGGRRPWFLCAYSSNGRYGGRKVANLYGAGRLFACRHSYRLVYAVQWEHALQRGHLRLGKPYRKLGADYERLDGGWPDKPKWMRQQTYARLLGELDAAEAAFNAAFCDGTARLLRRCGGGTGIT